MYLTTFYKMLSNAYLEGFREGQSDDWSALGAIPFQNSEAFKNYTSFVESAKQLIWEVVDLKSIKVKRKEFKQGDTDRQLEFLYLGPHKIVVGKLLMYLEDGRFARYHGTVRLFGHDYCFNHIHEEIIKKDMETWVLDIFDKYN